MLRSAELGRAIMCLPATNLELWLTTLITVSLQQDDTNRQQLRPSQLLDLLSSGEAWVYREPGMYVELHVTLREEPVQHAQLQGLIQMLLQAPLWEQLMLQPSLPTRANSEPRTIHLNISYSNSSEMQRVQQCHRIFSNVPAADVRPPEGISAIAFHSVQFNLQFLDPRPRQRTARKRPKTSAAGKEVLQKFYDSEDSDDILHEGDCYDVDDTFKSLNHSPLPQPVEKKRKLPISRTNASLIEDTPNQTSNAGEESESNTHLQPQQFRTANLSDEKAVQSLVDGALRFAIYGNFTGKSACGIKVKANTFHLGLADIAPALWRPGYLTALSQRAHLLNTVSRSIKQVALGKATSMSLKHKVQRLDVDSTTHPSVINSYQTSAAKSETGDSISSITCRLWRQLQKSLASQPVISVHTGRANKKHAKLHPGPDVPSAGIAQTSAYLQNSKSDWEDENFAPLCDGFEFPEALSSLGVLDPDSI